MTGSRKIDLKAISTDFVLWLLRDCGGLGDIRDV